MSNNVSFRVYGPKKFRQGFNNAACFACLNHGYAPYDYKKLNRVTYLCCCDRSLSLDKVVVFVRFTQQIFGTRMHHKMRITKRHFKQVTRYQGETNVIQQFKVNKDCWKKNLLLLTWGRLPDEYPNIVAEFYDATVGQILTLEKKWKEFLSIVIRNSGWGHALYDGPSTSTHTMTLKQFMKRFDEQNLSYVTDYFKAYKEPAKT